MIFNLTTQKQTYSFLILDRILIFVMITTHRAAECNILSISKVLRSFSKGIILFLNNVKSDGSLGYYA